MLIVGREIVDKSERDARLSGRLSGGHGMESTFEHSLYSRSNLKLKSHQFVGDLFHLRVTGPVDESLSSILTPDALFFVEELEAKFGDRRRELLNSRRSRRERLADHKTSL